MKKSLTKKRKLNSCIKDAEEDNHKIFQKEKKKRPKRRQKRMIKRLIKKKHESENSKNNSNKKHKLKSGHFKFINCYVHDPY